jgi:hypothetical protein
MIVPFFNEKCALPLKNKERKRVSGKMPNFYRILFLVFFFSYAHYTHTKIKKNKKIDEKKKKHSTDRLQK